jgi:hypothetical protein
MPSSIATVINKIKLERRGTKAYCVGVKEQAKHYYRYGTKKDCEAKWDYFSVCFSTKLKSAEKADVNYVKFFKFDRSS